MTGVVFAIINSGIKLYFFFFFEKTQPLSIRITWPVKTQDRR